MNKNKTKMDTVATLMTRFKILMQIRKIVVHHIEKKTSPAKYFTER